jgi:hypothetical protein
MVKKEKLRITTATRARAKAADKIKKKITRTKQHIIISRQKKTRRYYNVKRDE